MIRHRRVDARQVRKLGSLVVLQFYLTAKLHQLYGGEHANTTDAARALTDRVDAFCERFGSLTVHCENAHVFVNQVRLRRDHGMRPAIAWLVERFRDSGLAALGLRAGGSARELCRALAVIAEAHWEAEAPPPPIAARLRAQQVATVTVRMRRHRDETDDRRNRAEVSATQLARAIYLELQRHASHFIEQLAEGQPLLLRDTRLLVQRTADLLAECPGPLLTAVAARNRPDEESYLARHMTNVCVLSLAMGLRLGIERRHLLSLGCAALLYDAGMVRVPLHERGRSSELGDEAARALSRHPEWVVRALFESGDRSPHTYAMAAIVARHHNGAPYPALGSSARSLCTEILMLADAYDALAWERPWRHARRPDDVLRQLLETHEPALVKLLANVIGVFPVGTLVRCDTGEIGIVVTPPPEAGAPGTGRLHRPRLKLLLDARGANVDGIEVDLDERDAAGRPLRSIVEVLPAEPLGVSVDDLLRLL